MKRTLLSIFGRAVLVCASISVSQSVLSAQARQPVPAERASAVLGPDDSITVLALNCEEVSKEWRIGATGDVTFPLIGRVHLAGTTIEQAQELIATKLKRYLHDPQVTVYPTELRSRPVTVAGAVEKPGQYQMTNVTTLFDALIRAGGPKNPGSTVTVKRSMAGGGGIRGEGVKIDKDGSYTMAEFELKSVMDGPDGPGPNADFALQPFDVITVSPAAAPRYVHIVGEVTHPGSAELVTQDSVSLMKLIATAGGLTRTASAGNALIMHVSTEGVQTSTAIINVKGIMDGKMKDIDLIAGDIVMIPSSKIKVYSQMFTSTAMSAGLSTAIFSLGKF